MDKKKKNHNAKQKNKQFEKNQLEKKQLENEQLENEQLEKVQSEKNQTVSNEEQNNVENVEEKKVETVEETIENTIEETVQTENNTKEKNPAEKKSIEMVDKLQAFIRRAKNASPESYKILALAALKVALPVLAMIIVLATVVSLVQKKNEKQDAETAAMASAATEVEVIVEPLEVDAYQDVNSIMSNYYNALAAGDMDTVQSLMDYVSETDLLQLKNGNGSVESYHELTCYTRKGEVEGSYFVYVTYKVKFAGFDALVPGLMTHYVHKAEDGTLKISKVYEENGNLKVGKETDSQVNELLMLSTSQDDVEDIFNKVDVEYKEILASNEELSAFLIEMSKNAKTTTGEEIAKNESGEETTTESEEGEVVETQDAEIVVAEQTQIVDEEVKTTATVNVRSSDSENADKVGRLEKGSVVKRTEDKINGWSKIIFEGKEAYVKSDYLEVISSNPVEDTTVVEENNTAEDTNTATTTTTEKKTQGTVTANTNVNVRNKPSTSSDTIGTAQGGTSYKVIEDQGEWLKIEFKGQTGFVKAEFFD